MRINRSRQSQNVEDRRASGPRRAGTAGGLGLGGIVLVLVAMYFGVDPAIVLDLANQGGINTHQTSTSPSSTAVPQNDEQGQFVARVLGDTEDVWHSVFAEQTTGRYPEPRLVLYRGLTPTACGTGQAAMGPFYCPADQKVYLDLAFFDELKNGLHAGGDFAQAYVIAHEIGHHVQNALGTFDRYGEARSRMSPAQSNAISVRIELQADCYAGVWAHHAQAQRDILEPGDVEEALRAAAAVGDDALQRKAQGQIVPDSFTHGTSAQRMRWFQRGLDSGELRSCDTFSVATP